MLLNQCELLKEDLRDLPSWCPACASEAKPMVPTIATRATSINGVVLFMLFGKRE